MSLWQRVAAVEDERDRLREQLASIESREREIARAMYRRGYLAGRAAQRRGSPVTTAPERHARGTARKLLS